MKQQRSSVILCAITGLISCFFLQTLTAAVVIIDIPVETGENGWSFDAPTSDGSHPTAADRTALFTSPGSGIAVREGLTVANVSSSPLLRATNADISQGATTLQAGTYTVTFALGNYNNVPFSMAGSGGVTFAGLTRSTATSEITPSVASGFWDIWSITWDVSPSAPEIGNALSFEIVGNSAGNAAFDGVGTLSSLGSGLIVEFTAIPEPSTSLLAFGGISLFGLRRRRLR